MSQNVPTKKIQVAARQSKVATLFLKNMTVQKISEIFGVDRKTIQRDLRQIKFNFRRSMPNEVSYKIVRLVLCEHSMLFQQTVDCLQQAKSHEDGREYLKLLKKLWDSKTAFLEKIGIFEGIPEMLGPEHDLYEETTDFSIKWENDAKKKKAKLKEVRRQAEKEQEILLERLLSGSKYNPKRNPIKKG